ncbi:MAG: hypothetical protein HHAS10_02820 [Candidatus Altimarinota bacterium]
MDNRFLGIGAEQGRVDMFPHLGKVITAGGGQERRVSPMDLEGLATFAVNNALDDIKHKRGPYIIKNQRIPEWVAIQVIRALIAAKSDNIVSYEMWLSSIIDDVRNHTDAILKATTGNGVRYISVDFTMNERGLDEKVINHGKWSHEVYVGRRQMRIPHIILYVEGVALLTLTNHLEEAIKNGSLKDRDALRRELPTILASYSGAIPAMRYASPDSRNTLIQTPLDAGVIRNFTEQLGIRKAQLKPL